MKIQLSRNGEKVTTGEIDAPGHLGAHLVISEKQDSPSRGCSIGLKGYDTSNPDKTEYREWKAVDLEAGDSVEIKVDPSGPADAPDKILHSTSQRLFEDLDPEHADRIITTANQVTDSIQKLLVELKDNLPPESAHTLSLGVGKVLAEIYSSLKKPVYRKYPEKRPEQLNDLPL